MNERVGGALVGLGSVTAVAIAVSALDALWRMTRAHEKIEQHIAVIERHLVQQERTGEG